MVETQRSPCGSDDEGVIIMKCQNCGKNEVNFHYSSNVNGNVTEAHLCSECAKNSGYNLGRIFNAGRVFNSFFPLFGMNERFPAIPIFGFGSALPYAMLPWAGIPRNECSSGESCAAPEQEKTDTGEIDEEMQKRREIGVIREQMRLAAENEDFERAAKLRDKIRQLEAS